MELFVFWLLCGVVAAVVVSSKGGSGFVGFLVGALLGPLGIIIAFFMGNDKGLEEKNLASGTKKKCPKCAELVLSEAMVCKHCGGEFIP
jgi:hypothetical protein